MTAKRQDSAAAQHNNDPETNNNLDSNQPETPTRKHRGRGKQGQASIETADASVTSVTGAASESSAPSPSLSPSPGLSISPLPPFVVDSIFPRSEIHLVGGPSHSGKTTLVLHQIIARFQRGLDVFGHASHPAPYAFVACERPLTQLHLTLSRIGIDPDTFPGISLLDDFDSRDSGGRLFDDVLAMAQARYDGLQVLFVDGIHRLCPGKATDMKDVTDFLCYATRRLQQTGITLIGIGHAAKTKGDERFGNPRERFLGSSSWSTASGTMIIVERPDDILNPKRTVMILPPNAKDQVIHYALDEKGLFQLDGEQPDRFDDFATIVSLHEKGTEFTARELLEIAAGISDKTLVRRTIERYIQRLVEDGRLEKSSWGRYRVPTLQ